MNVWKIVTSSSLQNTTLKCTCEFDQGPNAGILRIESIHVCPTWQWVPIPGGFISTHLISTLSTNMIAAAPMKLVENKCWRLEVQATWPACAYRKFFACTCTSAHRCVDLIVSAWSLILDLKGRLAILIWNVFSVLINLLLRLLIFSCRYVWPVLLPSSSGWHCTQCRWKQVHVLCCAILCTHHLLCGTHGHAHTDPSKLWHQSELPLPKFLHLQG